MKWIRHLFIQSYGVEDPMLILPGLLWHQPGAHSVLLLCVLMLLTLIFSLRCSALSSQHSLLKWASSSENETQPLGMLGSVFVFKVLVHPWALYFIMLLYFCQQFLHLAYALCQLLNSVFPQSKGHLWDCSANSSIHFLFGQLQHSKLCCGLCVCFRVHFSLQLCSTRGMWCIGKSIFIACEAHCMCCC